MKTAALLRACLGATFLCLLALGAGRASAASLTVTGYTKGETVDVISAGYTGQVMPVEFKVVAGGDTGFSYCVDLAQEIGVGSSTGWELRTSLSDSVIRAAWLVDTFRPTLDTLVHPASEDYSFAVTKATAIAALQVAVWEVMSEAPGDYNLYGGAFAIADGGASAGVMNLSRDMLGQLNGADLSSYTPDAIWAVSRTRQDQLFFSTVNPIPEPSTVALYAFGAVLVGFSLRKKLAA